jgi:hypothetical protein
LTAVNERFLHQPPTHSIVGNFWYSHTILMVL